MSNIDEEIREMAKLTMLSNKLNDVQLTNLKTFVFVYFNGIKKVALEYDLSNYRSAEEGTKPREGGPWVSYSLEIDETQDNPKLDVRFNYLERSVRELFWSDTKVIVKFNGKTVFESKNGK